MQIWMHCSIIKCIIIIRYSHKYNSAILLDDQEGFGKKRGYKREIMKNIVIWGYASEGIKCLRKVVLSSTQYNFIGFADNSPIKQHKYVDNMEVYSLEDLVHLKKELQFSVIIASGAWREIGRQLKDCAIEIEGIYVNGMKAYKEMTFEQLNLLQNIKLYAGDICDDIHYNDKELYGLSIVKSDEKHIFHDITQKYPLPDNCIAHYQAEDVLEHIEIGKLIGTINEIYRILKPGALFRICLPDYYSPYLSAITLRDEKGEYIFDPTGGGILDEHGVHAGGHVWFPNYRNVKEILDKTAFLHYDFLCYHKEDGTVIKKKIDFSNGYINRISESNQSEEEIYSIVVDCIK